MSKGTADRLLRTTYHIRTGGFVMHHCIVLVRMILNGTLGAVAGTSKCQLSDEETVNWFLLNQLYQYHQRMTDCQ